MLCLILRFFFLDLNARSLRLPVLFSRLPFCPPVLLKLELETLRTHKNSSQWRLTDSLADRTETEEKKPRGNEKKKKRKIPTTIFLPAAGKPCALPGENNGEIN
jgi:hypothetical protein